MPERQPTVQELFDLSNRFALLVGGTGHLGPSIASALAEAGAAVALTSRSSARAEAVAAILPPVPHAAHTGHGLDYLDPSSIEHCVRQVLARCGRIDVLVIAAHEAVGDGWQSVSPEQFTRELANTTGYFLLARLVRARAVEHKRPASIIFLTSMYGLVGSYPDAYEGLETISPVAYHALKGGLIQLTRHLAVYWARDGIRVNCLSPGPFCRPSADPRMVQRLREKVPLKRIGLPRELKGAVVFLASDASSYVTGQNLVVDGGWTAW